MDNLDKKILSALQTDGRMKYADLARHLGVAPSTVLERVRRLQDKDVITGYRALINPRGLQLEVQAFITINLESHNQESISSLQQEVQRQPYVRACYHLTGRFDFMLHVAAKNLDHLGEIIKHDIAKLPRIGKVETLVILNEEKPDSGWAISQEEE